MSFQLFQGLSYRKRIVFWVIVSYALLLLMSYGFPITGDDWYFYPQKGTKLSLGEEFSRAVDISLHHYQTTNGRLLGNFFVSFLVRKIFRELVRCGLILLIIVYTFRLSGNRSFASYLMCFALLIAMPASVVSQTYTWAAGFFMFRPHCWFFCILITQNGFSVMTCVAPLFFGLYFCSCWDCQCSFLSKTSLLACAFFQPLYLLRIGFAENGWT